MKPENILLDDDGEPKLTDFGIASVHGATSSTMVSASWNHAPPETFRNKRDERSDLYSLASTLHTLITGIAPFADPGDESLGPLVHRLLYESPPALPPELAPPELAAVVWRSLAKEPAERPQSAEELIGLLLDIRGAASVSGGPGPSSDGRPVPVNRPVPRVTATMPVDLPAPPAGRRVPRRVALVAVPLVALAGAGAWYGRSLADDADTPAAEVPASGGATTVPADGGATTVPAGSTVPALGPVQWSAGPVEVQVVAGLPDGRVAVGGKDGQVRLFDPADLAREPVVWGGFQDWVSDLAALTDGRVAAASDDGTVRVWDPDQPEAPPVVYDDGSNAEIHGLTQLPDGRLIFGRVDSRVEIWDPDRPVAPTAQYLPQEEPVRDLLILPDGRLATAAGPVLRVWNPAEPTADGIGLEGHTAQITSLALLTDGRLASAADDGTIRVWDLARPEAAPLVLDYGETGGIPQIVALPDGRLAAVEAEDAVTLWVPRADRPARFRLVDDVDGESEWALALMPDGRLLSGASSGTIRIRPVPLG